MGVRFLCCNVYVWTHKLTPRNCIMVDDTATHHGEMMFAANNYHECSECSKMFDNEGQPWKTHCLDCYKIKARKCECCDRFLKMDAPKYAKTCTTCWLKKRGEKYATCDFCPPEKASHLRRKIEDPACKECMHKKAQQEQKGEPDGDKENQNPEEAQEAAAKDLEMQRKRQITESNSKAWSAATRLREYGPETSSKFRKQS